MGLFDNFQKEGESLFRARVALDFDYMPKLVKFRENEQHYIASCIKPLFEKQSGRNLLLYGPPGIGKTVATRHVLSEIVEHTDDVIPLYINCWQKNTTYKILLEICERVGYALPYNKNTQDLFKIIKEKLNKYSVVFCFDEVDKLEDFDILYMILEDIYKSSLIMITNYKTWLTLLDERIRSRLTPDTLEFRDYNDYEIKEILKYRLSYAFAPTAWEENALQKVFETTLEVGDVRSGLYLLKESGMCAEEASLKKITLNEVEKAISKLNEFSVKDSEDLETENKFILEIIKQNSGNKIGDLFEIYEKNNGQRGYKSFQRAIKKLADANFILAEKVTGGGGNSTIVKFNDQAKTLSDY
ncbi:AAA family ATPase [Candidatus Woesearchaeota archaeon]|nr:AAA family ATPase [Candidatus Woesearchaeota archaeon]